MRELLFIVAVASLLSPVPAFCQNGKMSRDIDAYVRAFVEKGHFSGVVLAKKDGKVVL